MGKIPVILASIAMMVMSAPGRAELPEFTSLVKKTSSTVVNISAKRVRDNRSRQNDQLYEEEMPEFFRRFFREIPGQREPTPAPSMGSGFIISSDGYILTNNHVVDNADEIIVALSDRRELLAEVVGKDELSDLALLKIDAEELPTVEIGSSEDLQVGEWVVAIGLPFGFEHSVTAGIVSAKGRSLPGMYNDNYVPYIQSDVAINPGNSGGPLFDLEGRVVGINSQILTRSGGFLGLSFAIPVDVAMEVVQQLKEKGSVSRGYLGVLIQGVNRDLAESFGMDRPEGALINEILPDGPAAKGGLQVGDVIVEFNGQTIDLSLDLPLVVGRTQAESEAELVIFRDGKKVKLTMKIGALPEREDRQRFRRSGSEKTSWNRLGIQVVDLKETDRSHQGNEGVLVQRITEGPAMKAGLLPGDVITILGKKAVHNREQFEDLVKDLPTNVAIPVLIVRDGMPSHRALKIPE